MYRNYDPERDFTAVRRIWKECGWIDDDEDGELIKDFLQDGETLVGTINDVPECCVNGSQGTIAFEETPLPLGAVAAVTTSHIARRTGYAKQLTAELVSRQARSGMAVSALGMFDQGFYDQVGFGTGPYEHMLHFDPARLKVEHPYRPPRRLTVDDLDQIHTALVRRQMRHGGVCLDSKAALRAELKWTENPFGLGYFDGPDGSLSHFIWGETKGENGPYRITWRAYENFDQLNELLALIRSLGDQVNSVTTLEFGEVQLQDLLDRPFRTRRSTQQSPYEQVTRAIAYWQLRMVDLERCLSASHFERGVRFNLELIDPVTDHLPDGNNWPGLSGDYVIDFGPECRQRSGRESGLPTLRASVNAFSRLWFGVQPASSLAFSDDLSGDATLIRTLDDVIRLPAPHLGWDF